MRIAAYEVVSADDGQSLLVSALTDRIGATWTLQYRVSGTKTPGTASGGVNSAYAVSLTIALASLTPLLPTGLAAADALFEVRLIATYGSLVAQTAWKPARLSITLANATPSATLDETDGVPRCTVVGDAYAGAFADWMALSAVPGITALDCVADQISGDLGHAILESADLPGAVRYGAIAYAVDYPDALYTVAAAPWIIPVGLLTTPSGATITLEATPHTLVVAGLLCYPTDDPSAVYVIQSVAGTTITLDRTIDSVSTSWLIETTSVLLDDALPPALTDGAAHAWVFDTVGRRLLEALARSPDQLRRLILQRASRFSPFAQDTTQPWFGHALALPAPETDTAPRVVGQADATRLPLRRTTNLPDFLMLPCPTYYQYGTLLLFNRLQLIDEALTVTPDAEDASYTVTLGAPVLPGTAIYLLDPVYGWQALAEDTYTLSGTLLTVLLPAPGTTVRVRYEEAAHNGSTPAANLYDPFVRVSVDGASLLPMPHPLWNALDDVGLLLGAPRLWLTDDTLLVPIYETNADYQVRLEAAALVLPDVRRDAVTAWLALRLGTVEKLDWDGVASVTLPAGTTRVVCPHAPETALFTLTLLRDTESARYRYYVPDDLVVESANIYIDGVLTDYDLQTSGDARYILLAPELWLRNPTVTASCLVRFLDVDLEAGTLNPAVPLPDQAYTIYALTGPTVSMFSDPAEREGLVDVATGLATARYRWLARTLLRQSTLLAGTAVWGVSVWFVRGEYPAQLSRLPSPWR